MTPVTVPLPSQSPTSDHEKYIVTFEHITQIVSIASQRHGLLLLQSAGNIAAMRKIIAPLLLILIAGCTSLKDFQKMDANTRAGFVCDREDQVRHFAHMERDYQSKVDDVIETLERGYRVHKWCRTVVQDIPNVKCTTVEKDGTKTTTCEQITQQIREEVCNEIPVNIDADLEKENLERYRAELENAKVEKNTAYFECYSKIKPMSAEEAFSYYKSH